VADEPIEISRGRVRFAAGTVVQIIIYVLLLAAVHASLDKRITALEAQRAEDAKRLERIENKLDRLLERQP
jgi:hypothetical protein